MEQGICGYVTVDNWKGKKCVKKRSRFVDYTIEAERYTMRRLECLKSSHFPKMFGSKSANGKVDMYMEYIEGGTLYSVSDPNIFLSLKCRTVLISSIAFDKLGFSHNDLHKGNIMVRKVDVDVDRYVFEDGTVFEYLTYGVEPVIIDFGLSFIKSSRMLIKSGFTDLGYFPFEPDHLADARRLFYDKFADLPSFDKGVFRRKTFIDISTVFQFRLMGEIDQLTEANAKIRSADKMRRAFACANAPSHSDNSEWGDMEDQWIFYLIDLFSASIKLPLVPTYSVNARSAYADFCTVWLTDAKVHLKIESLEQQLLFVKNILDKPLVTVSREYKSLFRLDCIKRLKHQCERIVSAMTDIMAEYAKPMSDQKQELYSKVSYKTARDVVADKTCEISIKPGARVRTYNVATATTTIEIT